MIRSITQKKPEEEIDRLLNGLNRIFIIGCGTCVTLTRTGGEPEVRAIKKELSEKGKLITGHAVVPVACDNLSREFLGDFGGNIDQADALLVMTSAGFGCTGVVAADGCLAGILTDGDLRRHMSDDLTTRPVTDIMSTAPKTITPEALAAKAVALMQESAITSLFVVDEESNKPVGFLNIHDCLQAGVI